MRRATASRATPDPSVSNAHQATTSAPAARARPSLTPVKAQTHPVATRLRFQSCRLATPRSLRLVPAMACASTTAHANATSGALAASAPRVAALCLGRQSSAHAAPVACSRVPASAVRWKRLESSQHWMSTELAAHLATSMRAVRDSLHWLHVAEGYLFCQLCFTAKVAGQCSVVGRAGLCAWARSAQREKHLLQLCSMRTHARHEKAKQACNVVQASATALALPSIATASAAHQAPSWTVPTCAAAAATSTFVVRLQPTTNRDTVHAAFSILQNGLRAIGESAVQICWRHVVICLA